MMSSQDEACKLEFRSEKIPYHSVHSNSFFFPTVSIQPFITKDFFFRAEKILGMLMWRVIGGFQCHAIQNRSK